MRRDVYPHGLPAGEAIVTPGGLLARAVADPRRRPGVLGEVRPGLPAVGGLPGVPARGRLHGCALVAMPALGAWDPFWPLRESTRIAIGTLEGSITRVSEVHLVLSNATALEIFAEALARR